MKQYRVTSENFVTPGESGDPDAMMDPQDLRDLRRLAGVGTGLLEDYYQNGGHDPALTNAGVGNPNPISPIGSNISQTASEKHRIEKEKNIRPGDPEWFRLWFSKPLLTGEKPVGDAPAPKVHRNKKHD